MVDVYSDVAFQYGTAAATVLALSDKDFIGYYSFVFKDSPNSTYSELQAILSGLRALKLKKGEEYTFYTDSSSALKFLCSPEGKHKSKECLQVAKQILEETKDFTVRFELCVGHQKEHNPNKVVDKASRYILRSLR